ncbi:MAG: hypothetical protein WD335_01520 [Candidatus Paceibacterota bacterium]
MKAQTIIVILFIPLFAIANCSNDDPPLTEFPYEDPTDMTWCISLHNDQDGHVYTGIAKMLILSEHTLRFTYNIPGRRVEVRAARNQGNENVSYEGFDIDRKDHMGILITMKNKYHLEGIIYSADMNNQGDVELFASDPQNCK